MNNNPDIFDRAEGGALQEAPDRGADPRGLTPVARRGRMGIRGVLALMAGLGGEMVALEARGEPLPAKDPSCQIQGPDSGWVLIKGKCKNGLVDGYGEARSQDGSRTYIGEYQQGKFHGQGSLTWSNGQRYVGEFKDGKFHGQGTWTRPNERYEGQWLNGNLQRGVATFSSYGQYVGEFKGFSQHGQGTFTYSDGSKLEGRWQDNGCLKGIFTSSDGVRYVGELEEGSRKHGQGTQIWPDGRIFIGEFRDDQPVPDSGIYGKYEGERKDGEFHGKGILTFDNGERYEGDWQSGRRNGKGTQSWPDGRKYEGEFRDDEFHGQGIHTWTDSRKYEGQWQRGQFHGKGTHIWPNGEKYEGEWQTGKRNGQGAWTWPDGTVFTGEFRDDQPIGESGSLSFSDRKYKKPNAVYIYAGQMEASGKLQEAKLIYQYLLIKFPDDSLAIRATDRLIALRAAEEAAKREERTRTEKSGDRQQNCTNIWKTERGRCAAEPEQRQTGEGLFGPEYEYPREACLKAADQAYDNCQ